MIYNNLFLGKNREFEFCSNYTYMTPQKHPSRIMKYHDLVFITKGSITITQDDYEVTANEHDILFLTGNRYHYSDVVNPAKTECFFIHFSVLEEDLFSHYVFEPNEQYSCIPMHSKIKEHSKVVSLFKEIIYYFNSNIKIKNKICSNLLSRLLLEIEMNTSSDVFYTDELVSKIISVINNHITQNFTISDFANKFNVSERTIQKRFSSVTNTTIHQYILQQKLDMAAKLLLSFPNLLIQDVAHNYGFYDAYHFSKLFKSRFGCSPSDYKKNASFE